MFTYLIFYRPNFSATMFQCIAFYSLFVLCTPVRWSPWTSLLSQRGCTSYKIFVSTIISHQGKFTVLTILSNSSLPLTYKSWELWLFKLENIVLQVCKIVSGKVVTLFVPFIFNKKIPHSRTECKLKFLPLHKIFR